MGAFQFPTSPFQRILCCTDFSESADFAFTFALDAAVRRPGSTLFLLHVIPEADAQFWKTYIYEIDGVDEKAKRDINEKVRSTYLSRVPRGIDFQVEYRAGKDSQQILQFAEEKNVDLIVIGRHGRNVLGKTFFGNVTEKIARKAPCAVMIVPLSFQEKLASSSPQGTS